MSPKTVSHAIYPATNKDITYPVLTGESGDQVFARFAHKGVYDKLPASRVHVDAWHHQGHFLCQLKCRTNQHNATCLNGQTPSSAITTLGHRQGRIRTKIDLQHKPNTRTLLTEPIPPSLLNRLHWDPSWTARRLSCPELDAASQCPVPSFPTLQKDSQFSNMHCFPQDVNISLRL